MQNVQNVQILPISVGFDSWIINAVWFTWRVLCVCCFCWPVA